MSRQRGSLPAPRSAQTVSAKRILQRLEQVVESSQSHRQRTVDAVGMTIHRGGKRAAATLLADALIDPDEVLLDRQRGRVDRRCQVTDDRGDATVDAVDAAQD